MIKQYMANMANNSRVVPKIIYLYDHSFSHKVIYGLLYCYLFIYIHLF